MGRAISVSTVFGRGVSGMAWYKKNLRDTNILCEEYFS